MNEVADIAVLKEQQQNTDERLDHIETKLDRHGELLQEIRAGVKVFCWIASVVGATATLAATLWAAFHKHG